MPTFLTASSRLFRLGFFVALSLTFQALCAQTIPDFYKEPGIYPNRDYVNQHFAENIDPFTGALQLHYVDIHLPGNGGFDLKVVRSYNSNRINPSNPADYSTFSLAGMGWTVHFGRVLKSKDSSICVNTDGGTSINDSPVLELPDGSRQVFTFPSGGSPLMLTTQRWKAECIGGGTGLAVYSPDGVRYDMTRAVQENGTSTPLWAWYTTRITDRNGNYAVVNYNGTATPEIANVTTSDGRTVTFSYYDSGLLSRRIRTITVGARVWTYNYTAVTNVLDRYFLTSVTRPDAVGSSWGYSYNTVVGNDNPNNYQMSQMRYPQGGTVNYGYGHVYFDTTSNPGSRSVVVASKSTSDGGSWSFSYTPGSFGVYDTTVVTTPTGTITYKHIGANTAGSGNVWKIGLLVQKSIGSYQTETYGWGSQKISAENNLRQGAFPQYVDSGVYAPILTQKTIVRDGVTYQTTYSGHDAYGNPTTVTEGGPNGGSRTTNLAYYINTGLWIVKQVDDETTVGVGSVVREWDSNGNMLSETRDGVKTSYTYYSTGDIWTITRPRNLTSTYSNYYRGIPKNESHPESVSISRVVDDYGNVTSETNGEGQTTGFGYDGLNRLASISRPLGNATSISYTATQKTATRGSLQQVTSYDGFGRPTTVSTAGQSVTMRYDSLGRKTFNSVVGSSTVGHLFQYDQLNRVTRITHNADNSYRQLTYSSSSGIPTLAVRDERGYVTTHAYRAYGDPDQTLVMSITAPVSSASVSMQRNGRGQVTSATQNGVQRTWHYDSRYYMDSADHPEVGHIVYGRDDAGNMTSRQVGSSGTTIFEYDGRNRLWRVTYPSGNPSQVTNVYWRTDKLKTVTNGTATRSYTYDNNQNLKTETITIDGLTLAATYNYNGNDQLSSIDYPVLNRTVQFDPDVLGRPRSIAVPAGSMLGVAFWPNGQIYDIAYAGGSRATYGQNTREWPSSMTVKTGDGTNQIASTYAYDVAGNMYNISDTADSSYNRSFAYDEINRLTTVNGPWGSGTVGYDGAGNITSYSLGTSTRSYSYDTTKNRLSSVTTPNGTTSYFYDVYGNASAGSSNAYTYDNANNMTYGGGCSYAYDGTNVRVKTTCPGGVTMYEFRSAHGLLLAEWRKQAGFYDTLKEHMYLAGKEVAEQRTDFLPGDVKSPTWMFLQPDPLGSPASATWAGGGLLFKDNYEPYGIQRTGAAAGWTQRAFAGSKHDSNDDFVYMGGRYYSPQIGRMLSVDAQETDPSDLHSLNRYAYANNNPYRHVDPDGRSPVDVLFFAADAAKLGVALYTGVGVGRAAGDLALSAVGVLSPVPGTGQALKMLRVAQAGVKAVRAADRIVMMSEANGAGAGDASGTDEGAAPRGTGSPNDPEDDKGSGGQPDLKSLHPESTIKSGSNRYSYDYWKGKSTEDIVKSLRPGEKEALRAKPDGTVMNGNTRLQVLRERGVNVNQLPREVYRGS